MKERILKEAVVTATKVKFYVRGDTLVYNADAFQLEEGSMLDALIRQLPGAELKDDGRIMVNEKQVESLLLNGEDFFKKDSTIMLENLPTYMVNQVKVYEKEGQASQLLGQNIGDQKLVMDVRLKKQYEIGWMGNIEAVGGTHERYLARLFVLRFTAHSRLSAFANVNNLNDRQRPGVGSEWMPAISEGLSTTRNGGVDYLINDRRHRFKLEGDAVVSHTDTRNAERTTSQSYSAWRGCLWAQPLPPKTLWDVKDNKAKGKSCEARDINLALDNIKAQIIKHNYDFSNNESILKVTSQNRQSRLIVKL